MDYAELVKVYEKLESTTKRLEKTEIIADALKKCSLDDLDILTLLIQGKIFPNWDERKIGVASRIVLKAINVASGISIDKIEKEWKKTGDLGLVSENLIKNKKQATLFSKHLTIKKVFENLRKLSELEGIGTVDKKISFILELLTSAASIEAKYIVRIVLEDLRIGVGEGSFRDAIVWAFFGKKLGISYNKEENNVELNDREEYNNYIAQVQHAFDITNDFASVVREIKKHGLKGLDKLSLEIGKPIKVMLAIKVKDIEDGFERVGKPCQAEYKLDGFRMQVHKKGKDIKIFTRRLENVTKQFPDVVEIIKNNVKSDNIILDGEAVGYSVKTGKYLPFQNISQRIKRKYDIAEIAKKLPVELNVFDILAYQGKSMINELFEKRRKILEKIIKPKAKHIVLVKGIITDKEKEIRKLFEVSIKAGNEGLMLKKLDAPYKPGARVGHMVKLKSEQEALDLVIVAAEWGEGKRAKMLSSFTLACIDDDGNYLKIGKVGTGIKEKSDEDDESVTFSQLTDELKPHITEEKGREIKVKPKVVVEIAYEEIQKSPTYSSGFALRFPRVKRLRTMERSPKDITHLSMVEDLYYGQKK